MTNRVNKAAIKMRRNRRDIYKLDGADYMGGTDSFTVTNDPAVFDGVDATAEELILHFEARYTRERAKVALLYTYAQSGLATEMTMHEANSLLGGLKSEIRSMIERYPKEKTLKGMAASVSRLDDNFSFLSRFKASGYRNYQATPRKALDAVEKEFGRAIGWGELVIERTDAFMKADIANDERILYSAFLNLVRNSYQLGDGKKGNPVIVRFDSVKVEHEENGFDDETDEPIKRLKTSDIIVISDNGPGFTPGVGESIFDPGVSGRRSSGIGLHLVKSGLESTYLTIVADEEPAALGGASFRIGKSSILRPVARDAPPLAGRPREVELAEGMVSLRELVESGYNEDAVSLSDVYEEAAGMALRIRLRGADTDDQQILVDAVDAFEEVVRTVKPLRDIVAAPKP